MKTFQEQRATYVESKVGALKSEISYDFGEAISAAFGAGWVAAIEQVSNPNQIALNQAQGTKDGLYEGMVIEATAHKGVDAKWMRAKVVKIAYPPCSSPKVTLAWEGLATYAYNLDKINWRPITATVSQEAVNELVKETNAQWEQRVADVRFQFQASEKRRLDAETQVMALKATLERKDEIIRKLTS